MTGILTVLLLALSMPAAAADKEAEAAAKANRICESWKPVKAKGPVDMAAGFADYCSIFLEIDSELLLRTDRSEIKDLKEARKAMSELLLSGETPRVPDTEKLCTARLGMKKPASRRLAAAHDSFARNCSLIKRARELVKEQGKRSPRPSAYYMNMAAVRVSAVSVTKLEESWHLKEKLDAMDAAGK